MAATQTMLCLCHYDVDFVHFNTWRHLQFTEVWLVSISKQLKIQSNLDYPDLDYPDFSIIRTFSLVPFFS